MEWEKNNQTTKLIYSIYLQMETPLLLSPRLVYQSKDTAEQRVWPALPI